MADCMCSKRSDGWTTFCSRRLHRSSTTSLRSEQYDLWIGDEACELDYYLHENPELQSAPYCWLTDFVGWLPTPGLGEREAYLTADYNAEMIEHDRALPARASTVRSSSASRRCRPGLVRPRSAVDQRLGRAALPVQRLRGSGSRSARSSCGARRATATARTSGCTWSPSAFPRCRHRSAPPGARKLSRGEGAVSRRCAWSWSSGPRIDPSAYPPSTESRYPAVRATSCTGALRNTIVARYVQGGLSDGYESSVGGEDFVPLLPAPATTSSKRPRPPPYDSLRREPLPGHRRAQTPRRSPTPSRPLSRRPSSIATSRRVERRARPS